jgi:hypothetical protein
MRIKDQLLKISEALDNEWTFVKLYRNSLRDALELGHVIPAIQYRNSLRYHLGQMDKLLEESIKDEPLLQEVVKPVQSSTVIDAERRSIRRQRIFHEPKDD